MLWFQPLGKAIMDSVTPDLPGPLPPVCLLTECTSQTWCNVLALSIIVALAVIPAWGCHADRCPCFRCGAARCNLGASFWVKIFTILFLLEVPFTGECIWHSGADEAFVFPAGEKGILKISHTVQAGHAGPHFTKWPLLLAISATMWFTNLTSLREQEEWGRKIQSRDYHTQIIAASLEGQSVLNHNQHLLFATPITALWIVFSKRKLKNAHTCKWITLGNIYKIKLSRTYTHTYIKVHIYACVCIYI